MHRQAHSLFLIRFFSSPSLVPRLSPWSEEEWLVALGETYQEALAWLQRDGYLVPATLCSDDALSAIQAVWGVSELKAMSRARGLKVTRRKVELAMELLERDFFGMKIDYENIGLLALSEKGCLLANEYHTALSNSRQIAAGFLVDGQYAEAVRIANEFDKSVGFPKGDLQIGVDSDDIERIMTAIPSILEGCSCADLQALRLYVALDSLGLPSEKTRQEMRASVPGTRFDFEVASRMLLFNAHHKRNISQARSALLREVELLSVGDDQSCEPCKRFAGKKFMLDQAPDLPNRDCESVYGCRCTVIGVIPTS